MVVEERGKALRVLIATASSYSRLVLQDILESDGKVQLAQPVADSDTLLSRLKQEVVELVVLDHDLPGNQNLHILKRIFSEAPLPVLLLLQRECLTLDLIQQAVELGVYAVVLKPGKSRYYTNYRMIGHEVLRKVLAVRETELFDVQRRLVVVQDELALLQRQPERKQQSSDTPDTIIVIGASTGGTKAVESIIRQLSWDIPAAVLVALHLPDSFTSAYAKRLQELTTLKVVEGREGTKLQAGKVIVAPGGKNMVVQPLMGSKTNLKVAFTDEKPLLFDQPSIDLLMQSVAKSPVQQVIGVILTGMGKDGTAGASYIKERGGVVVAQDEKTSAIFGMARSAIAGGYINKVLPLQEIPQFLNRYVAGQQQVSATDSDYEIERTGI